MKKPIALSMLFAGLAMIPPASAQLSLSPGLGQKTPSIRNERLVPAAMGIRTDKQGNSWNIEQNGTLGRVGTSMVNSGVQLVINSNQNFYTYQPMMTADGSEFVLHSRQNSGLMGLHVMRRIKLIEDEGIVRYLEIFTNATSNPVNINVSLRNNFSGNYKSYLTNEGNSGVVMLGQRETAILVTPGSTQSNRAFVFSLSSPKSPLKPVISSQNKYGLTFQYNLAIPAGQTAVLAHAVSQVPVPRSFERKNLSRIFKPVALDRLMKTIPRELRPLVVNFQASRDVGATSLLSGSIDGLGVNRSRRDVLALGEKTRLVGTASSGDFKVKTAYGEATIPFEQVAAIVGNNGGRRDLARVYLRDGQVLSGEVVADDLKFVMASGGRMNLEVRNLDRLVRGKTGKDSKWGEDVTAMVETFGGDRIAVEAGDQFRFNGMTPWGRLEFSLDDILWLAPMEDEPVGHYVEFKDGTRCFVFLAGDQFALTSPIFGDATLDVPQIRAAVTRAAIEQAREQEENGTIPGAEPAISQSYLKAAGKQRIVGPVTNPHISILTNNEAIQLAPEEIRRMVNLAPEEAVGAGSSGPLFQLELWGGGVMTGFVADGFVSVRVRGSDWQVPLQDVRELVTPVPRLADEARQQIAQLIRQLGSVDWQTREKATEELSGFGYIAKTILQEELQANPDPEVQRRIERILAGME